MRKFMSSILLFVLVAMLSACGGGGDGSVPAPATEFTTQLLDSMTKVYIQSPTEPDDPGHPGTVREFVEFINYNNAYFVKVTASYFDAIDTFIGSGPAEYFPVVLNPDGTLTVAGIETVWIVSDQGAYLVVSGDDGSGLNVWTSDWYMPNSPAGWVEPTYAISYQMIRHNTYETGENYQAYVTLTKNGLPVSAAEYSSMTVYDGGFIPMTPISGPLFWDGNFVNVDCRNIPCTWSNYQETGAWARFNAMPFDDVLVEVDMTDTSVVMASITYSEDLSLPFVASASMMSSWQGSDLSLSWTNPTTEANWNRVTQLRLSINDGSGALVGSIKITPTDTSTLLTDAMLQDMYAIGDGTIASWRVEARTYVSGITSNPQIARSYSNLVTLSPSLKFTTQMLDGEPTFYISHPGDPDGNTVLGLTQQVVSVTGNGGTYAATVTVSYFDDTDTFVGTGTATFNCVLNVDGTLTCTNFLDPTNIIDFTLIADNGTHYVIDGIDNLNDNWQDLWYVSQPVVWLSAYSTQYEMLRHRTYENGTESYNGWLQLMKDGQSINPAEFVSVSVADTAGAPIALAFSMVTDNTYANANCSVAPCTWNNSAEVGAFFNLSVTPPALMDYVVTINLVGGGTIDYTIRYDENLTLPNVASASMMAAWQAGDLVLDWTNPVGDANWNRVDQLRIILLDSVGTWVGAVRVDPVNSTVTLPAALIADMAVLGNGTVSQWIVQTRAYSPTNPTNMQIARGHSNTINLPPP